MALLFGEPRLPGPRGDAVRGGQILVVVGLVLEALEEYVFDPEEHVWHVAF